ncbi:MAG: PepSY1/2 domain-containing protein [Bacillota bacterium]
MEFKNVNKHLIGVVFLALLLTAVGYWGYSKYIISQQLKSEVNNRYEYAFQGLNHHIDALESELGALLISQSANNVSINLSNVWRSAYSAQEDIGQLPITSDAMNNVKYLLADVLKYTNHLDKKIAEKNLTEEDKNMINKFYEQIGVINVNLQKIHSEMDKEKFKWYDKKRVKINEEGQDYSATPLNSLFKLDQQIAVDSFQVDLEKIMPNYKRLNQRNDVLSSLAKVEAATIDQEEAVKIAKSFIKNPDDYNYEVKEKKGVKLKAAQKAKVKVPAYEVKAIHKDNSDEIVYADVSKKGGKIVWMLKKRDLGDKKINYQEAEKSALEFVRKNRYNNMSVSSRHSFNDFLIVSLIPVQNKVLIKPDSVTAEVALDNGEVVAFNGINYLLKHKTRAEDKLMPKLTLSEAENKISNRLNLTKEPRLIIDKIDNQEKLCYEFIGKIKDGKRQNHYLIKINAKTGQEEEIKGTEQDIYKEENK